MVFKTVHVLMTILTIMHLSLGQDVEVVGLSPSPGVVDDFGVGQGRGILLQEACQC